MPPCRHGKLQKVQNAFLGLGTGLGSALVVDGIVEPMELGHLPYMKSTFEDYVGIRGLQKFGKKKWRGLRGRRGQGDSRRPPNRTKSCWAGGNIKKTEDASAGLPRR